MTQLHAGHWMMSSKGLMHEANYGPMSSEVSNILSATSYRTPLAGIPPLTTAGQLPLGVVIEQQGLPDKSPPRSKKRTRAATTDSAESNEGSEEANKRQRGRPKVDGRDETAVDRRRTQIRLAQRAYRNRKESTITTLQTQVEDMQVRLTRMNKIFTNLYDNLQSLEVISERSQASRQLECLRQEFTQIHNLMSSEHDDDGQDPTKPPQQANLPAANDSRTPIIHDSTTRTPFVPQLRSEPSSGSSDRETNSSSSIDNTSSRTTLSDLQYEDAIVPMSRPSLVEFSRILDPAEPSSGIDEWMQQNLNLERAYPLRTGYTYSFQETSFARRLQRQTIESAFRKLGDPHRDPAWIARTFHFTLSYTDTTQLRTRFQIALQRGAGEPLESVEMPYFHVGGAGTHFLQRDEAGKPVFPPNLQNPLRASGPWKLLEDPDDVSNDNVQKLLGAIGYEGEWYDAREVEEYLKTKGIYLDGYSSFVDIDSSGMNSPKLAPTVGRGSMTTSTPSSDYRFSQNNRLRDLLVQDMSMSFGDGSDRSFFDDKNMALWQNPIYDWSAMNAVNNADFPTPGFPQAYANTDRVRPGTITMDVSKFLDRIVHGASCLGRAPGFRRAAIDQALALAIQEAF